MKPVLGPYDGDMLTHASSLHTCEAPTETFAVEILNGQEAQVDGSEPAPLATWRALGGPMAAAVSLALEAFRARGAKYLAGRVDLITGTVKVHWVER